jgi:hypothetical protein
MSIRGVRLLPLLLVCCKHDLAEVKGPAGSWLPDQYGEACASCASSACATEEEACRADKVCFETFHQCYPSKPSCGVRSGFHRAFAACLTDRCLDECKLQESELGCVGGYSWPKPDSTQPTRFEVEVSPFAETQFVPVSAAVCGGSKPDCKESTLVEAESPGRYPLEYQWSAAGQTRPYVRVSGDQAQTVYIFEGAPILDGHVLPVTVLPELTYTGMLALLGQTKSEERGTIVAIMLSCSGSRLANISFRLVRSTQEVSDSEPVEFYVVGSVPLAVPNATATQEPNYGGFANVAPGTYSVIALRDEREVGRIDAVHVLGGALTQVNITPLTMDQDAR